MVMVFYHGNRKVMTTNSLDLFPLNCAGDPGLLLSHCQSSVEMTAESMLGDGREHAGRWQGLVGIGHFVKQLSTTVTKHRRQCKGESLFGLKAL